MVSLFLIDSIIIDISQTGCYNLESFSQELLDLTGKTKEQLVTYILGYIKLLKDLNSDTVIGDGLIYCLKPFIVSASKILLIENEDINVMELLSKLTIDESLKTSIVSSVFLLYL